jgi:hypothetical protein
MWGEKRERTEVNQLRRFYFWGYAAGGRKHLPNTGFFVARKLKARLGWFDEDGGRLLWKRLKRDETRYYIVATEQDWHRNYQGQRAITICLISSFCQPRNMPVEACHGNHDQPGTSLRRSLNVAAISCDWIRRGWFVHQWTSADLDGAPFRDTLGMSTNHRVPEVLT